MATDLVLLRELRPDDVMPTEAFLAAERSRLLQYAAGSDSATSPKRTPAPRPRSTVRRRRWALLPVAAVLVTATAVFAATRSNDPTPTRVACRFDAGTTSVVDLVSGNPVVECRALWVRTHDGDAPPLRAYRVNGSVLVLRADATPPSGAVAVDGETGPDASTAAALTELEARLHDYASGLWSQPCIPFADAVTRTRADLTDLGLADTWSVRAEPPVTAESCGLAFLAPESAEVVVRGVDAARWTAERSTPAEVAFRDLGHSIADALAAKCLPVDRATDRVRALVASAGYPDADIRAVVDREASCTRATLTVAGTVNVVLHGPQHR